MIDDVVPSGYELIEPIERGGMATVYLARQTALDRLVAVKVMAPGLYDNPQFRERFLREARALARLDHPNIIRIHEIREEGARLCIVMEYAAGGDLKTRMAQPMAASQALAIARDVAAALHYAHSAGFIHRDVKPQNVLFSGSGRVLLTDFGIARSLGADTTQLTQTGLSLGTPAYMAPEQFLDEEIDHRVDLYSLGVMLFQMLAGHQPFRARSTGAIIHQHVSADVPRLGSALVRYQALIDDLMAKAAADRPVDGEAVAAMIDALTATQEPEPVSENDDLTQPAAVGRGSIARDAGNDTPPPAYRGSGPYIFVSYAHADARSVYPEINWMQQHGFNVWWDEGLRPGARWSDELGERIAGAATVVYFISPNSVRSQHCLDEAHYALDRNKPILAIHLAETVLPTGLDLRLGSRQAVLKWQLTRSRYREGVRDALSTLLPEPAPEVSPLGEAPREGAPPGDSQEHGIMGDAIRDCWRALIRSVDDDVRDISRFEGAGERPGYAGLIPAHAFGIFLGLLWAVVLLPARLLYPGFGISYQLVDALVIVVCLYIVGFFNYGAARLLGSRARVQSSMLASLVMSRCLLWLAVPVAISPNLTWLQNERGTVLIDIWRSWSASSGEYSGLVPMLERQAVVDLYALLVVVLVAVLWLYYQHRVLAQVHRLEGSRAATFFLLTGLIAFAIHSAYSVVTRDYRVALLGSPVALRAIAVVPFAHAGGGDDTAAFASGLTDSIWASLSDYDGVRIAALSRSPGAARDADYPYRVEGSVIQRGDRIRMVVQLVRVDDTTTVWARSYEREQDREFSMQDMVARDIAQHVRQEVWLDVPRQHVTHGRVFGIRPLALAYLDLAERQHKRVVAHDFEDWELYEALLRAAADENRKLYRAQVLLADQYQRRLGDTLPIHEVVPLAHAALARADELATDATDTLLARGAIAARVDLAYADARESFTLARSRGAPAARYGLAELALRSGRPLDAVDEMAAGLGAEEEDEPSFLLRYAMTLLWAGRTQDAAEMATRALSHARTRSERYLYAAALCQAMGGAVEGARLLADEGAAIAAERRPEDYARLFALTGQADRARAAIAAHESRTEAVTGLVPHREALAHAYLLLDEVERALDALEAGIRDHDVAIINGLRTAPMWNALRDDVRFEALVQLLSSKERAP